MKGWSLFELPLPPSQYDLFNSDSRAASRPLFWFSHSCLTNQAMARQVCSGLLIWASCVEYDKKTGWTRREKVPKECYASARMLKIRHSLTCLSVDWDYLVDGQPGTKPDVWQGSHSHGCAAKSIPAANVLLPIELVMFMNFSPSRHQYFQRYHGPNLQAKCTRGAFGLFLRTLMQIFCLWTWREMEIAEQSSGVHIGGSSSTCMYGQKGLALDVKCRSLKRSNPYAWALPAGRAFSRDFCIGFTDISYWGLPRSK